MYGKRSSCWGADVDLKPANIEAIFSKAIKLGSPGAALALILDGRIVYKRAWGLASIENPVPLTTTSVFNTGSLAKQFTAFAIFRLLQMRKLSLEDEVRRHLPELPNYGRAMRLRHLLWHTSGLRCYTTLLAWGGVPQRDNYSRKQALELVFRQRELNFLPGDGYLYGNSNYLLLSEIVERLSGRGMAEFCRKEIFGPLGMRDTHFRERPAVPIPNLVSGHWQAEDGSLLVARSMGAVPGVGRLMSHVEDLGRWEGFFVKTKKASLPVLRSMLTQGWLENGQKIRYGGGLMFQRYRGLAMVRHDGFTSGCRAEFCRFPEKGLTLACLCNDSTLSPTALVRQVVDSLFGRELEPVSALGPGQPPAPKARASVSKRRLAELVGLYRSDGEEALAELQVHGSSLRLRDVHSIIDFAAESQVSFQGVGAGSIYRLDLEDSGGFILTKLGRARRYARLKLQRPRADSSLERFVGRYASPELVSRLDVRQRDGKLWLGDAAGFELELRHLKGGHFESYFRDIHFSKRSLLMEGRGHWVRRLRFVKL
jgi:CubicO group peptidase (beta-lactamase class C family)